MNQRESVNACRALAACGSLLVCLFVNGCAQMQMQPQPFLPAQDGSSRPGMSSDEQLLAQQSQTYSQTQLEGCLVGAGLGAAGGCVFGKCDLTSVLIGTAVGAVVGCAAGSYVANLQQTNATEEQRLNVVINDVRRDSQNLANLNTTAKRVIAADKAKLDQLKKSLAAGRISREQAKQELASVDANQRNLEQTLGSAKKKLADLKQAANTIQSRDPQQRAEAEQGIRQMEQQVASLESELQSLVERRQVTGIG